jgi:hypothetical protein
MTLERCLNKTVKLPPEEDLSKKQHCTVKVEPSSEDIPVGQRDPDSPSEDEQDGSKGQGKEQDLFKEHDLGKATGKGDNENRCEEEQDLCKRLE